MSIQRNIEAPVKERARCRRKFLHYFPGGFNSSKFMDWERGYKWNAHLQWEQELNRDVFEELLIRRKYKEIAAKAVRIESRTNLLFSFEKMALRDAVASPEGARAFSSGLFDFIYGDDPVENKFKRFLAMIELLPRKQTRVFTWPIVTVFGFIADPGEHIFLKPLVTKAAAAKYQYTFFYQSRPQWETYNSLLAFSAQLKDDLRPLKPRDMIDIQSYIWVMGSEEYPDLNR